MPTSSTLKRRRSASSTWSLPFLLPGALFLGVFAVYPLAQLVRMSVSAVTSANLTQAWPFSGMDNFAQGWAGGNTQSATLTTVAFVVIVTVVGVVGGLGAAIALRHTSRASALLLGLLIFVWALPPVVNGSVWKFLLGENGLLNVVIRSMGLDAVPFLYSSSLALVSVAMVNSWAIIPFNALVFRAAILGVPEEVFEASQLDGASKWQQIRYVLVPSVKPAMLVLIVLTIVYAFRSFDFIYVMTFGGPGTATNTLPFLGYLQAFIRFDFGLGASTAVIALLLVIVLAVVYARSVRKEERDS